MEEKKIYTMDESRIRRSLISGAGAMPGGEIHIGKNERISRIFFPPLDGVKSGCIWGRIHIDVQFPGTAVYRIYALAKDEIPGEGQSFLARTSVLKERAAYFKEYGFLLPVNSADAVLYEGRGRFLWLYIEVENGMGGTIQKIQVMNPGDEFLFAFPEVYRQEGSFFHRYMTIFSSIYYGIREEISRCSMEPVFEHEFRQEGAVWSDFYWLGKRKGTKEGVVRLLNLLGFREPVLAEKEKEAVLFLKEGYRRNREETLNGILYSFFPAGFKLKIVYSGTPCCMDDTAFLDLGTSLTEIQKGRLDGGTWMGQSVLGSRGEKGEEVERRN